MAAGNYAGLRQTLERGRRLAATALAFAAFGGGAVLLALLAAPLLLIPLRTVRQRQTQRLICHAFGLFVDFLDCLGLIRVTIQGKGQLGKAGGVLIIANHPTLLDVVILLGRLPRAHCLVKHQLWRNPFLAPFISAAGYIRNDQPAEQLLEQCRHALQQQVPLVIFPEGTRTPSGQVLGPLQRGVANIALAAQADILPVCIRCNHDALKKGSPWYAVPATTIIYDIEVAPAFSPAQVIDCSQPRGRQARHLTDYMKHNFRDRLSHASAGR
ncbi:1-acyl-sn-glycerol-3-phosphate acyltransferase [Methylohalomonas lacus]|uniref:1-acyl-sn-glycerol-3-phosphate acyltransferase n=1 Tax=Methylohalomonas lacus TaxID=398773 RepID=A0AAE3L4Y5_9GAMM|nr:lysophospholipid acyltransferase family protein [Methylohalomonas lacus]MCS3902367.1 1-acyl-sn-glycerol-3-phosphate acyltransferase [Methylohalomonas lacus]